MQLRNIQRLSNHEVEVANLSCGCKNCMQGIGDLCQYKLWRKTSIHQLRECPPEANDESTNTCIHLELTRSQSYVLYEFLLHFKTVS